jgi:hypothetical protein
MYHLNPPFLRKEGDDTGKYAAVDEMDGFINVLFRKGPYSPIHSFSGFCVPAIGFQPMAAVGESLYKKLAPTSGSWSQHERPGTGAIIPVNDGG